MSVGGIPYDDPDALMTPDFGATATPPVAAPPAPPAPTPDFVGPIDSPEHARALAQQEAAASMSPQDGPVMPRVQQAGDEAVANVMQQQAARQVPGAPGAGAAPIQMPAMPPAATPATPAGPPSIANADADLMRSADEAKAARAEADKARIAEMQGGQADAHAAALAAKARSDQAQAVINQQQAIQQKYDAADVTAQKQIDQTQAAIKGFKFRDYWADRSSAEHVGAALGVALGALGSGLTGTPNYALQILNKKMDDDHRMQVESLNGLKDEEVMARTGLNDSRAARSRALADVTMGDAAKDRLIAAQLDEAAARNKDQNYQQTVTAFSAKLKEEAADKDFKARVMLRNSALAEESARAKMEQEQAAARLANTKADAGGFAPRKGAAAHGGGGAGRADALAAFTTAALDGKTGEGDLAKLGLRAGLKPNQVSAEVARIRKEHAGGASGGGGAASDRLLSKETEAWAKQNGIADINKKQRELSAVLEEVHNAPHNPLQQALAVEKAVSSARGGAASKQALALALHHLGGKWDSMEAVIQGIKDGELGQAQMDNFIGFMTNQLGTAQREGKDKYDDFNKYIASQPAEKRAALEAERGRLFSGLHGFGAAAGAGAGDMVPIKNRRTGETKMVTREEAKRMGAIQ